MWGDGNFTSTASDDYYQATAPASTGQPYFCDMSQVQVETAEGPHDGSNNSVAIQDQANVQAVPSTYCEYCFGMVSSLSYAVFHSYHVAMVRGVFLCGMTTSCRLRLLDHWVLFSC